MALHLALRCAQSLCRTIQLQILEKYDSMNIVKSVLFNMLLEEESILLVGVRTILFLMFFLIALHLSYERDMLLFWLTVGGMTVYALLIIGVFFFRVKKRKKGSA